MKQNTIIKSNEEIDLKDLFIILWRSKNLIISITLVVAIISGLFSAFLLPPIYTTKMNITINIPEIYHTKYGDYTFPQQTNQQYINLITSSEVLLNTITDMNFDNNISLDDLRKEISILPETNQNVDEQNRFEVKVTADNPEKTKEMALVLYDNFIDFLDVITTENAINYYINDISVRIKVSEKDLEDTQKILKFNNELLANTSQIINQKDLVKEIEKENGLNNIYVLENLFNPNYVKIENDIILNKQNIKNLESTINTYNKYLNELNHIENNLSDFYETGEYEQLDNDIIRIANSNVKLSSKSIDLIKKTGPNISKNVIICSLFGLIIGMFISIFKEFRVKL